MSWGVLVRPEVEEDIGEAVEWYERHREGLGTEIREAVIAVFNELADNPLLDSRKHPRRHIRWRYPQRFPYRVIYEVIAAESIVVVAAVLHAARHDRHWKKRL